MLKNLQQLRLCKAIFLFHFFFQEAVSNIFLNLLQFKLIIFYPIFCGHGEELSSLLPLVVSVLEDYSCGSPQLSLVQTKQPWWLTPFWGVFLSLLPPGPSSQSLPWEELLLCWS